MLSNKFEKLWERKLSASYKDFSNQPNKSISSLSINENFCDTYLTGQILRKDMILEMV